MSADSIAISRDLVAAGLEQKAADAIAQKIVAHSDVNAASKADLVRVEAKVDAEKEARAKEESDIREDIAEIKLILNNIENILTNIENRLGRLETSFKWVMGLLIPMCVGIFLLVIKAFFGG